MSEADVHLAPNWEIIDFFQVGKSGNLLWLNGDLSRVHCVIAVVLQMNNRLVFLERKSFSLFYCPLKVSAIRQFMPHLNVFYAEWVKCLSSIFYFAFSRIPLTQHNLLFLLFSAFIVLFLGSFPSAETQCTNEKRELFYDGRNCNKMINLFVKYTQFLSVQKKFSVLSLSLAATEKQ